MGWNTTGGLGFGISFQNVEIKSGLDHAGAEHLTVKEGTR
jgi:hypothetical protein